VIVITPVIQTPRPEVGAFMLGPKTGGVTYRIVAVTALRQAGDKVRYRLECRPAVERDIPPDAAILPYRLTVGGRPRTAMSANGIPPPLSSPLLLTMGIRDRWALERIQAKSPLLLALGLEPVSRSKVDADRASLARVMRMKRAPPGRTKDMRDANGRLLRAADEESDIDARDLDHPTRRIVRTRRADPLHTLLKHKSITARHFDAAEVLRADMEEGTPRMAAAWQSEVHSSPWGKASVSDRQVQAIGQVRSALAAVPRRDRLVLAWMIAGGTISGFKLYARCHADTAVSGLRNALSAVADEYFGGGKR
jgi:hypothetical protein